MQDELEVFIGWDSREADAFRVAEFSLRRHSSIALIVTPLVQADLRGRGLYHRADDPLASTEFTYTRFLAPHLARTDGWAIFCDCDFLWLGDVAELLALARPDKALYCVKHSHVPTETTKMDGAIQTVYPRKNWTSLMLFNNSHPAVRRLTPDVVNRATGKFLHRMEWLADDDIGGLPETWNWLEGWSQKPARGLPKAIHYTRGGPWFPQWRGVGYADLWLRELELAERATRAITGSIP